MRTSKGAARNRSKKRLFKRAKGYRGGRGNLTRTVKETLVRAGVYAYRDRKVRKRDFRRLWITRINAACRMRCLRYSQFIDGLNRAGVELDRKSLAEIAVCDPKGFDVIVDTAKASLGNGKPAAEKKAPAKNAPESKPAKESKPAAAAAGAVVKSPKGLGTDDLKVVEGLGPKCEQALKGGGIGSWADLAASTPDKIREILAAADGNFGGQVPDTWPKQAEMAVAGEWEKLEKWQDELDGGKEVS